MSIATVQQPRSIVRTQGQRSRTLNGDRALSIAALVGALSVLLMLCALLIVLLVSAWPALRAFGPHFLIGTEWRPNELLIPSHDASGKVILDPNGQVMMKSIPPAFGALPVIFGTAASSALALLFAVPLSIGAAIFLVRAAPRWVRPPISFMIEFLAAIPSIAYGIWAIFVLGPFLSHHLEPALKALFSFGPLRFMLHQQITIGPRTIERPLPTTGRDLLAGGIVLAVMIIPIITAIARDVLTQVPRTQIEGSVALGATWWESCREMLHYSRSALLGAVLLGLARAAGETMAVTMIIGNNFQIVPSPLAAAQTMSSLLANEFAEASTPMHKAALCEVALILLLMSLLFNITARYLVVGKNPRMAGN